MSRRQATGLTGPLIVAMLGAVLILMALRETPVLWGLALLGVVFLGLAAALYAWRGRSPQRPRFAAPGAGSPAFTLVRRGYDVAAVDDLVTRAQDAVTRPAARRRAVRDEILSARPRTTFRGYAVTEVDAYLREMAERLDPPPVS